MNHSTNSEDEELPEGLWVPLGQDVKDVVEEEVEDEQSEDEVVNQLEYRMRDGARMTLLPYLVSVEAGSVKQKHKEVDMGAEQAPSLRKGHSIHLEGPIQPRL